MEEVTIYTDGACSGNPGPGGWGAVLMIGKHKKEISGFKDAATNNRMELTAAVEALGALKRPCTVTLYSDSAYLVNAFRQGWIDKWKTNGWRTSKKDPVENQDLWQELIKLTNQHEVKWVKVKGHSANKLNERCDELAREEIKKGKEGN